MWTYVLYAIAGACWLPVVWIQIQFKRMVAQSIETGEDLPTRYNKLFNIWFMLGFPAFIGLVGARYAKLLLWLCVSRKSVESFTF